MKRIKRASLAAVAILVGFIVAPAGAALVAYEGFVYDDGTNIIGETGGFGWSGAWTGAGTGTALADATSPGLTYSDGTNALIESGNKLVLNSSSAAVRTLSDTFDGKDIWFSLIIGSTTTNSSKVALRDESNREIAFTVRSGDDRLTLMTGSTLGDGSLVVTENDEFINDEKLFVVMKLERGTAADGNDNLRLWLNPDVGVSAPQNFDAVGVLATDGSFGDLASARLFSNNSTTFDEVRIGETFASVTPIPEPASILMLLSGAVCLLGLRNRSRRQAS